MVKLRSIITPTVTIEVADYMVKDYLGTKEWKRDTKAKTIEHRLPKQKKEPKEE